MFRAFPLDLSVRLVGSVGSLGYGRVEIFHEGEWGRVCGNRWDENDGTVVCRQLGFTRAIAAPERYEISLGTGLTWLDDVNCTGKESQLGSCEHAGWILNNCYRYDDASVHCVGTGKLLALSCVKNV